MRYLGRGWLMDKMESLDKKIDGDLVNDNFVYVKDIEEAIKSGDKLFRSDYGNDEVTNKEYDYANKLWERFKKDEIGEGLVDGTFR